jgi:hypothetical protein
MYLYDLDLLHIAKPSINDFLMNNFVNLYQLFYY